MGHLDLLREHGFTAYRGPDPAWYEGGRWPRHVQRLGHLADVVLARRPPVGLPEEVLPGLWNLPGSMIYFPMHGRRRHIPLSRRVARAVKGLDAAAEQRRIFHLWFHPTNLAFEMDAMFSGLRQIFERAAAMRRSGDLAIKPMGTIVAEQVAAQQRLAPQGSSL